MALRGSPDGHYGIRLPHGMNTIEIKSLNHKVVKEKLMVYDNGNLMVILMRNQIN